MKLNFLLVLLSVLFFSLISVNLDARPGYWQMEVMYDIEIDFDVEKHRFTGKQEVTLTNHSPEALDRVYFHLYYNAFQPNSMMGMRAANIVDPKHNMGNRISRLKPNEVGYHDIKKITMDGEVCEFQITETIMDVFIPYLIPPGQKVTFYLEYESQVPLQIRRTGRENEEGVVYSMAQWYPKLAQFDHRGWHAHPYVGQEFYGIFGNYDVKINMDSSYTVAAGGVLQNPQEVGHGYSDDLDQVVADENGKLHWHFRAENVHDFAWAADTAYTHSTYQTEDGPLFRFFYISNERTSHNWEKLPEILETALTYIENRCGEYPYPEFNVIQGGDGGMEYPMATLITGERPLTSLVGVSVHELIHMWYYGVLATNESIYPYMDEGFTTYITEETMNHLARLELLPRREWKPLAHSDRMAAYINFAREGNEEPMSTFADHFQTNSAYVISSYTKAALMLVQLQYIVGKEALDKTLLDYYEQWKFKHPLPDDFFRLAERVSGLNLKWFQNYWISTTNTIDYGVDTIFGNPDGSTSVILVNNGTIPMPIDLTVYVDGTPYYLNIPLVITHGHKKVDDGMEYMLMQPWKWTNPMYELQLPFSLNQVSRVVIDESGRLADVNPMDNIFPKPRVTD
nr:M1 family peptidase [Saprospiraceae bacterium]